MKTLIFILFVLFITLLTVFSAWRKTKRIFFVIHVFFYCSLPEWPKWRKHYRELMRRPPSPECAAWVETRKEKEMARPLVRDIADQFGLPLELLRLTDRFGEELYLPPKYPRRDAHAAIFELIDLLFEEHGVQSRFASLPKSLEGVSVQQILEIVSPE